MLLEVLEFKAVEWATNNMTSSDIDQLEDINNSMKEISINDKKYIEKWANLNLDFHRFFRERCGNKKMNWVVEEIRLRITRFRYLSFMITTFNEYLRDHEIIIEALREKDVIKAKEAMEIHISRAREVLVKHFFYLPGV